MTLRLNIIPKTEERVTILSQTLVPRIISNPISQSIQSIPMHIPIQSDHVCYILRSLSKKKGYIGYTVNFPRRLRQHNGEIVGGAKKTTIGRPWIPVCIIRGFAEASSALRFEYRLQHGGRRLAGVDHIIFILQRLQYTIQNGDGSVEKDSKMPWPPLTVEWNTNSSYVYQVVGATNIY